MKNQENFDTESLLFKKTAPAKGWIKTVRSSHAMTAGELGKKLNISRQRVNFM